VRRTRDEGWNSLEHFTLICSGWSRSNRDPGYARAKPGYAEAKPGAPGSATAGSPGGTRAGREDLFPCVAASPIARQGVWK
jgi:hypothetical protein